MRAFAALLLVIFCSVCSAQTNPSTQPDISPQVKAILDQVGAAYAKASALSMSGKISLDWDVAGEKKQDSSDFTASFVAPNKFRHEVKDDVLVVSTGEKVYAYLPAKNQYVMVDAPKDRVDANDLPASISDLLDTQNPVLLLAISKDPTAQLGSVATNLKQIENVKLDGVSYIAISYEVNDVATRVLINPTTHFVRQIQLDKTREVRKRGVDDVKLANLTFDYLTTKSGEPAPAETYAWTPPRDATIAKEEQPDDSGDAAQALVGKPAPDFKLTGIDGTTIAMVDVKGSVTVLDFWATWCGPCVASLPHLNEVYNDLSAKGLKVYAVNLEEAKPAVQKFLLTNKLTLPVLLDTDGAVGKKYSANAIPETVIIGKDGMVKKVLIGFGGDDGPLRSALEEELKK